MQVRELKERFAAVANPELAKQMAAYLKGQFHFYGCQSATRQRVYRRELLAEKKREKIDWQFLNQAWAEPHREFQYVVCDYLITLKQFVTFDDLPRIEKFVRSKQWWDTIDSLIKPIGEVGLHDRRVGKLMLQWSLDPDIWVRRVAIEHQLLRKDKMDIDLLAKVIENNLDRREFFINKAIGWALRDYSKTNPRWVQQFITTHRDAMAPLSIREGSKYL
ncbi:DNA alkylation repair protein [Limosilactobacillus caecicola]|uniref:DNA alkylation repair protein n=1 Tax=Limosilactobacillus caecicola TaxID=2941332 RepID=UPI00203F8058|nr:DNA alkylation repair protein [Limosilactobacillus caecicola]